MKSMATNMIGPAELESKSKRIKRFFQQICLPEQSYARFIVKFLNITRFTLVIDRTCWFPGESVINFLVLGVYWKGHVIPLFMRLLDKKGNSGFEERKALLDKFIETFGKSCIEGYLGDREFPCKKEFDNLVSLEIPFAMRIKKNTKIGGKQAKHKACGMAPGKVRQLKRKEEVLGQKLYISIAISETGELVIIATLKRAHSVEDYRLRWAIEVLFGRLKTRGFNLEDTHLRQPERLIMLMQAMSIALVFVIIAGKELEKKKPSKIKKHGYAEESVFKRGLDYLCSIFLNLSERFNEFLLFLDLFSFFRVLSSS